VEVQGRNYRTVRMENSTVFYIEQNLLPFQFIIRESPDYRESCRAIKEMRVRGAGAIGALAGFAMAQAFIEAPPENAWGFLLQARSEIESTRPTARNLFYATEKVYAAGQISTDHAIREAQFIADKDAEDSLMIGKYGNTLIHDGSRILTHCNAGWLAFVDYGTATAPIYEAFDKNIKVHVWVDETRPRNQGASLTAWELLNHGVPHTIIADNTGGHLMQHGLVDMVITGADRVTREGDAANKIGTYLKALAAKDNNIPFYVALPSSTIDWEIRDGIKEIPIETRNADEVKYMTGLHNKELQKVLITPANSPAANYGFDVTPSRLITGLITERGICAASEKGIVGLYPEKK
jgi:methylthioribose-1-phosphate isomerase